MPSGSSTCDLVSGLSTAVTSFRDFPPAKYGRYHATRSKLLVSTPRIEIAGRADPFSQHGPIHPSHFRCSINQVI